MTLDKSPELSFLAQWDTPTICNALELIVPERRGYGFTIERTVCLNPALKPIVGYARTARCATRHHQKKVHRNWPAGGWPTMNT